MSEEISNRSELATEDQLLALSSNLLDKTKYRPGTAYKETPSRIRAAWHPAVFLLRRPTHVSLVEATDEVPFPAEEKLPERLQQARKAMRHSQVRSRQMYHAGNLFRVSLNGYDLATIVDGLLTPIQDGAKRLYAVETHYRTAIDQNWSSYESITFGEGVGVLENVVHDAWLHDLLIPSPISKDDTLDGFEGYSVESNPLQRAYGYLADCPEAKNLR